MWHFFSPLPLVKNGGYGAKTKGQRGQKIVSVLHESGCPFRVVVSIELASLWLEIQWRPRAVNVNTRDDELRRYVYPLYICLVFPRIIYTSVRVQIGHVWRSVVRHVTVWLVYRVRRMSTFQVDAQVMAKSFPLQNPHIPRWGVLSGRINNLHVCLLTFSNPVSFAWKIQPKSLGQGNLVGQDFVASFIHQSSEQDAANLDICHFIPHHLLKSLFIKAKRV